MSPRAFTRKLMIEFGKRLAHLRKARQLTQNQLADLLDVQAPVISRWENGSSKPQFDFLVKLAKALEVSYDALMGFEEGDLEPAFEIRNRRLKELVLQVDRLAPQDQDVVCHVMDSLIRKEHIKALMQDAVPRSR
jgi:transcriptional regulator with XRE-family HTH domain